MKKPIYLKIIALIFLLTFCLGCTSKKKKCDTCPKWSYINNSVEILIV